MASKLENLSEEDLAKADEKSRKRKAAREKMIAQKTIEKGLTIVHTGKEKANPLPLPLASFFVRSAMACAWASSNL